MVSTFKTLAASLVLAFSLSGGAIAQTTPPKAAITSAHPAATQAGLDVLAKGGNAFDAAIAVSAALAVVEPYSSGLGGGGFWLLHSAQTGQNIMIDGREMAPGAAHADMYQTPRGQVNPRASLDGALAAAIPGEPAALVHIAKHYGKLELSQSLAPAIKLAKNGFEISEHMHRMIAWRAKVLAQFPASQALLLTDDNQPLSAGTKLKQPDLAKTLQAIAQHGRQGFYQGPVADQLIASVRQNGGIWSHEDLEKYRIKERQPIVGHFNTPDGRYTIVSAPPPSAGGIVLTEALNILEPYPWNRLNQVEKIHLTVEAMRRAYRDRAAYLGDADFIDIPKHRLLSKDYAAGQRVSIRLDRATPSSALSGPIKIESEGNDTTHFSILDKDGNRVAATLSVNYPFGSGLIAKGTGVILNDEMDDFSSKADNPNGYGLVSFGANTIEPYKRPLSSMTPTFLSREGQVAILGTPGGSRITTMVLLAALNIMHGADAQTAVAAPRFHHQYLPDEIEFEPKAFNSKVQKNLKALGHNLKEMDRQYGDMQIIIWDQAQQRVQAASDPRGIGQAKLGD